LPGAGVAERDAVPRAAAPGPAAAVARRGGDQAFEVGDGGEGAGDRQGEGLDPAPVPIVHNPHADPAGRTAALPRRRTLAPLSGAGGAVATRAWGVKCCGRRWPGRRRRGVWGEGASESAHSAGFFFLCLFSKR